MARREPPSPALVAVGVGALLLIYIARLAFLDGPTAGELVVIALLVAAVGLGLVWLRDQDRRR